MENKPDVIFQIEFYNGKFNYQIVTKWYMHACYV